MSWINANLITIISAVITIFLFMGAYTIFKEKMQPLDVAWGVIAAFGFFVVTSQFLPGIIDKGYVDVKVGVGQMQFVADLNSTTGLALSVPDTLQQQASGASPSVQTSSSQTVAVANAAVQNNITINTPPEPQFILVLDEENGLANWVMNLGNGSPPTGDILVVNNEVQSASIPKGVRCDIVSGAAMAREASERWGVTCYLLVDPAGSVSKTLNGTWGRHFFNGRDTKNGVVQSVFGRGNWPEYSMRKLIVAEPEAGVMRPQDAPVVAAPVTGGDGGTWEDRIAAGGSVTITVDDVQPAPAPVAIPLVHTVASGDSLSKIARQYMNDAEAWPVLCKLNNLWPNQCSTLRVGQEIVLP